VESKCEYSSMQIPGDAKYATAAASYVCEIARMMGMQKQDVQSLEKGIIEAIKALIAYSFDEGEKGILEVSCERIPEGFKVSLQDKGLPFGIVGTELSVSDSQVDDIPGMAEPISQLKAYLDEIRLHNLGPEGKRLMLIKHLKNKDITDYYAACDLEPYESSTAPIALSAGQSKCRVRRMKPDDAAEVSKTIYKTYGYTYPHDYVYYPEEIIALNESGRLFSAVAVAGDNEIAGYGVFKTWQENPKIVEMAQGVVKPEFRSLGCFRNITQYLLDQAKSRGIEGAFGEAVTNHTISQHTVHGFGFRDCGLRLGLIPSETLFKGMGGEIPHRVSMLVQFLYLQVPPANALKIYAPYHHEDMIAALYKELGVRPGIKKALPAKIQKPAATSIVKIKQVPSMNHVRMIIERYGRNIVSEIKNKVKEICLQKTDIVNLFLNLSDPLTCTYTAQFENLGFFFSGILPGGFKNGHALILQYLNNVPIDYDAIQVESIIARKIRAYVRKQDPNRS
jgi:anti-sigma regulatory factor (Ser/Thr protein kinase)/ribosomal protein S18 acetylase RimI-like enzyme